MKNKNIYIRKDLVGNAELSEMDFELYDEFNYDYENQEIHVIQSIKNKALRNRTKYFVDNTPINIGKLEKLLNGLKKKGATHIAMLHHPDHHGYEFSGFNIELADDELINKYKSEISLKEKLDKEYKEVLNKLNNIKNKLNNLRI